MLFFDIELDFELFDFDDVLLDMFELYWELEGDLFGYVLLEWDLLLCELFVWVWFVGVMLWM